MTRISSAAAALAGALALAACGSSGGEPAGDDSGPTAVQVVYLGDQTGTGQSGFTQAKTGVEFALEQLKKSGDLHSLDIHVEYQDTTSDPTRAVPLLNQAVTSDAVAVFGPGLSSEAVALAPLAQRARIPYLTVQAGSAGVVDAGDYIFRVTPPQTSYQSTTVEYLSGQDVKSAYFIYNASLPTLDNLVNDSYPPLLDKAGIETAGSVSYQAGTTEFSAYISRAMAEKPGAIGLMTSVAEASAALSQLHDAGYQGVVFGNSALGVPGTLNGAGDKATGAVWSVNFSADAPASDSAKAFVTAFQQKYDRSPTAGEAEGYDLVLLLSKALNTMHGNSRAALQKALVDVTREGLKGAQGDLTFKDRDARVAASVVKWDGAKAVAATPTP